MLSVSNILNYSHSTNIIAGTDAFDVSTFYLQSINIPGVSFSHPELSSRGGARFSLNADTTQYGQLSFSVLIDEKMIMYAEVMSVIQKQIKQNTFTSFAFDFWIAVTDNFGNEVIKWTFTNCKFESIGDMTYNYSSTETEMLLDITLKYDVMEFISYSTNIGRESTPTLML